MSSVAPSSSGQPSQHPRGPLRSHDQGPFAPILAYGENTLCLERTLSPAIMQALEQVARGEAFEERATLDAELTDVSALLARVSHPIARAFLEQDMTSLVQHMGAALGRRHLHGQLCVMIRDGCRKFHTDNVTLRMLCTYAGPGTQWVRNDGVVRSNLARTDVDFETANRSVVQSDDAVRECSVGDILLLKGEAFEGNRGHGAVHRSPPIVARSLRRLVFKIDESRCGC